MQDNYVGDIGDYGKYGLLRAVAASGLTLAVNWYRVVPAQKNEEKRVFSPDLSSNQGDGKYISYLGNPEKYRHYDPELFDCLLRIVTQKRCLEALQDSGILEAAFSDETLTGANRSAWHQEALQKTSGAEIVFLDPDNGLETFKMAQRRKATEKHVAWSEAKDYYDRGQSVILYQHRPQRTRKEVCIQRVMEFQNTYLWADQTLLLEYPRYTNRYYFLFAHKSHLPFLEQAYQSVIQTWEGMCRPISICRPASDQI